MLGVRVCMLGLVEGLSFFCISICECFFMCAGLLFVAKVLLCGGKAVYLYQ